MIVIILLCCEAEPNDINGRKMKLQMVRGIYIVWFAIAALMASPLGAAMPGTGRGEAPSWKNFRGPGGQGHANSADLPIQWSEDENIDWKTAIPGVGYSAPVIEGNQVWLTTAFHSPSSPEEVARRTVHNTGSEPITVSDDATMHAICIDLESGEILKDIPLLHIDKPQWVHVENSYATPTPIIENGRLYCHFGTFGTVCVDTKTGEKVWTNQDHQIMHENGPASSPLLWRDWIIFHCDGSDKQYIAALDKVTGAFAWKTTRTGSMHSNPQLKKAYGTPVVMSTESSDVLVSPAANWLYAYDPLSGKELWKVPFGVLGFSIVPRPVVREDRVYICTGYVSSHLLALGPIRRDAPPAIEWEYKKQVPQKSSPLLVDHYLYFISDRGGVLTCLDAETGTSVWRKRIGGGYSASPISANDRMYFFAEDGRTTVLQVGESFRLLAENTLAGRIMASPAVSGDSLLIRTERHLYKISNKP